MTTLCCAIACALRKRHKVRSTFRCQKAIALTLSTKDRPSHSTHGDRPITYNFN
ncbi:MULTISPECIES: hypothetical protein [unclassified Microcoleus]|uniref:hypothetical protein n=1 Tax=unclassified Microcoleus TaxID=2642155 RepID=UPI002FD2E7D9